MSETVLSVHGLRILAQELRDRYRDTSCTCPCDGTCNHLNGGSETFVKLEERDRRWAAQKLLTPLYDAEDNEGFNDEEMLEIYCQVWDIRAADKRDTKSPRERFEHSALQLQHSTKFVRDIWKLGTSVEEAKETLIDLDDDLLTGDDEEDWIEVDTSIDTDPPIPAGYDPSSLKIF